MRLRNSMIRTLGLLSLLLIAGCAGGADPVLRVESVAFTEGEVGAPGEQQLEELADLAALGVAVARQEIDSLVAPLVAREVERSRLATLPHHLGARRLGIDERALREGYLANPEWELTVRHLVRLVPRWAPPAQREAARKVAEDAAARARAGEDLARLAASLSEEPGAEETGGLLRPGRAGSWVTPFWEAASTLEVGENSPVVETEYGYHVLRLENRRALGFEEAARLPLLRRAVPGRVAMAAMEEWAATRPPVEVDPEGVSRARRRLLEGCFPAPADLAEAQAGRYSTHDLALAWMALPAEQRAAIGADGQEPFLDWVREDARETIWARAAVHEGAEPLPAAGTVTGPGARLTRAVEALGFSAGAADEVIARTALAALAARGQEARIAREEIAPFRPLLRQRYRVEGRVASCSEGEASSSEIRKSENTR